MSLYFANDQSHYKFFRDQIYIAAKNNLKELQEFFISEENDQILTNKKLDGYIDKIKVDYFCAGNIEINIATKIFNINIAIYEQNNLKEDYKHYSLFTLQTTTKEFILINFEERGHYNLLKIKIIKNEENLYKKNTKAILNNNSISTNNKNQLKIKPKYYSDNKDNENNSNLINVGDNKKYYEYLYRYLTSLHKAKYTTKEGEIKIHWNLLEYPDDLFNENSNQKVKEKKNIIIELKPVIIF